MSLFQSSRSLQSWLDLYGESHRHRANIWIHKICVPLIFWSLLGIFFGLTHSAFHLIGALITLGGLLFYLRLGLKALATMLIAVGLCLLSYQWIIQKDIHLARVSAVVFVLAWIGQFVGHKIEGKKPSFFQDLQFLFIGPLWVIWGRRR